MEQVVDSSSLAQPEQQLEKLDEKSVSFMQQIQKSLTQKVPLKFSSSKQFQHQQVQSKRMSKSSKISEPDWEERYNQLEEKMKSPPPPPRIDIFVLNYPHWFHEGQLDLETFIQVQISKK